MKSNPQWMEERFMEFVSFQLERVSRGEITESTIKNYYRPTKLFCEMNGCAQLVKILLLLFKGGIYKKILNRDE